MKRKLDDTGSTVPSSIRANEIIDLVFIEDSLSSSYLTNPTFTHQIFENENINVLANPNESRIKIFFSCVDLSSYVEYNSFIKPNEQLLLEPSLIHGLTSGFEKVTSNNVPKKISASNQNSSRPPGIKVHSFTVNDESFEIYLTKFTDDGATKLLSRAEKIAIWFIETADSIDFSDERWEVLMIYHVKKSTSLSSSKRYYFGGYFTLFTFRNPFLGEKLRICQALILPHLQGKGIGREMLLTVYRLAEARDHVIEVTVEDPALSFQKLRDKVDFQWAKMKLPINNHFLSQSMKNMLATISKTLKTCHSQSIFVAEALILHSCVQHIKDKDTTGSPVLDESKLNASDDFRRFRLDVKRRLLQENPDIKGFNKERKLKILDEMFESELKRFSVIYKNQ